MTVHALRDTISAQHTDAHSMVSNMNPPNLLTRHSNQPTCVCPAALPVSQRPSIRLHAEKTSELRSTAILVCLSVAASCALDDVESYARSECVQPLDVYETSERLSERAELSQRGTSTTHPLTAQRVANMDQAFTASHVHTTPSHHRNICAQWPPGLVESTHVTRKQSMCI